MKLWLIERHEDDWGYDEAHGFVVRAKSEADARQMAAQQKGDESAEKWLNPQYSTCIELTKAGQVGVILRNFNAG